jgi:phage terminase small subunit
MKALIGIALIAGYGSCFAQSKGDKLQAKEHISKQITLQQAASNSVFALYNIWGGIKVEGYSGNQVIIEIDQTIEADNAEEMAKAKQEFKLGFDQKADTIVAYTAAPYDTRPHQWRDNDRQGERRHYIVKLEYTVKVPNNMNLKVSTVNNGIVNVSDVYGRLNVNNVNGAITIVNAKNTTNARTVNGGVTVNYLANPTEPSTYSTINGKVEVTYKNNLAANLQFKSMNGQFYTDFDNTEILPTEVVKTETRKDNSTTYKLNKNTQIKVGAGGKLFKFETLNGNIYIKKA